MHTEAANSIERTRAGNCPPMPVQVSDAAGAMEGAEFVDELVPDINTNPTRRRLTRPPRPTRRATANAPFMQESSVEASQQDFIELYGIGFNEESRNCSGVQL